jgi:hypothetical protein
MSSMVTTATAATPDLTGAFSLALVLVFLLLLIQKELASGVSGRRSLLSLGLNIAIVPLAVAFIMIVGSWLTQVLSN